MICLLIILVVVSLDVLELAVLFQVKFEQPLLLLTKLVDAAEQHQVVTEVVVVVLVVDPEVDHLLEHVLETLVIERLLINILLLVNDLRLQHVVLLHVKALCFFLELLLLGDLTGGRVTVFSCSVFSVMREVIMLSFSSIMRFSFTASVD